MSAEDNEDPPVDYEIQPLKEPETLLNRLIRSEYFDINLAASYLSEHNDRPNLALIGRRMKEFSDESVDTLLPQLLHLCSYKRDVLSVMLSYFESRSSRDVDFRIRSLWILDALAASKDHKPEIDILKSTLEYERENISRLNVENMMPVPSTSCLENAQQEEKWSAKNQTQFIVKIADIARKMRFAGIEIADKENVLRAELKMINLEMPNRAWVPCRPNSTIVRIPPEEGKILDSKEKIPFLVFVETAELTAGEVKTLQKNPCDLPKFEVGRRNSIATTSADSLFGESFEDRKSRIRVSSPFGGLPTWDLIPLIFKCGENLTQEVLALQLVKQFETTFEVEGVPLFIKSYNIYVTGTSTGVIEPVVDAISLHQIKKAQLKRDPTSIPSLVTVFNEMFGPPDKEKYLKAQRNFIESLAGYSLICYYLQLKDRHNGNILLDREGHLIHIDYGFILSGSPRNLGFEMAPFKLTTEMVDVMGGVDSDMFLYFKSLILRGMLAARKHHERIVSIAKIMCTETAIPCFRTGGEDIVKTLQARFQVTSTDEQIQALGNSLVDSSLASFTTRMYDNFQFYTNGIH